MSHEALEQNSQIACYVMLYGYLYSTSRRWLFRGAFSMTGRWKESLQTT